MCVEPLSSLDLARLLLALTLGEPIARDDGHALALEVLRLRRRAGGQRVGSAVLPSTPDRHDTPRVPTLCFLPWATITEPLTFGEHHIVPVAYALATGEIPPGLGDAVRAVLRSYGHGRGVDQDGVPLIGRVGGGLVDDLTDDQVGDVFAFRGRLAFAVLATRRFFDVRYANSDHVRLVMQGFTPEQAGGAAVVSRRRDGSSWNMIPAGMFSVTRPAHVSGGCELPRDLDRAFLSALETAVARDDAIAWRLSDAARVFVGANTDSPDVSEHAELVDVVSAISQLSQGKY